MGKIFKQAFIIIGGIVLFIFYLNLVKYLVNINRSLYNYIGFMLIVLLVIVPIIIIYNHLNNKKC